MTYKTSYINLGYKQILPTDLLIKDLASNPELNDTEWWRRMAIMQNAAHQTSDTELLKSLNQVKEIRWGSGFPQQEVTTPQNIPGSATTDELNYFAPMKLLKLLLQKDWFEIHRIDNRYGQQWTDELINALMESEHKEYIATEWSRNKRQDYIRGCVLGLLKEAGVIKGSMDSIARSAGVCNNYRTFSKYMGQCRQEPYAEWVLEYIESHR